MERKPVKLFGHKGFSRFFSTDQKGSASFFEERDMIYMPEEWLRALKKAGVPLILFVNHAVISKGDLKKLREVTKRYRELYSKTVEETKKDKSLCKEASSAINYYKEFEKTGKLPNKCIKPPSFEAQVGKDGRSGINKMIIDVLNSAGWRHRKSAYGMHDAVGGLANCLITSMYYVCIARRLGMRADLYHVPNHAFIGIKLGKKVHYADPYNDRVYIDIKAAPTPEHVLDFRGSKKRDYYGLEGSLGNKTAALIDRDNLKELSEIYDLRIKLYPEDVSAWHGKAYVLSRFALMCYENAKVKEAIKCCRASLDFYDLALKLAPTEWVIWYNKAFVISMLAVIKYKDAKVKEAIKCCRESLDLSDTALKLSPNDWEILRNNAVVLSMLSVLENKQGRHKAANDCYARAVAVFSIVLKAVPAKNVLSQIEYIKKGPSKRSEKYTAEEFFEKAHQALEEAADIW